jgi:hypothetical protein
MLPLKTISEQNRARQNKASFPLSDKAVMPKQETEGWLG